MAVVVTGSSGFLGRALVARLTAAGHRVVGVDRRPPPCPGVPHLTADLTGGAPELAALLADADAVAHLAGAPGVRDHGPAAEARRLRDNVAATAAVLAHVPPGTPVVVTSSSSVYGGTRSRGRACRETDTVQPVGSYARSKAVVERLCAARAAAGGRVTVVRPFTVAGEHQRPDMALALWLAAVAADEPVRVLGSLDRTRDVTDVADVAEVLTRALERDPGGVLNAGTGTGQPLSALLAAVGEAVGREPQVTLVPAAPEEVPDTLADPARTARVLGITPTTDLPALVARQWEVSRPALAAAP